MSSLSRSAQFPDLNATLYEEDSKFLDLISSMASVSWQSAVCTFVCMFLVSLLFIPHATTLSVATLSILSIGIGVFGSLSWWGVDLDPIMMSAAIMSIGFSVDIPAHISYHFFKSDSSLPVCTRLEETLSSVGFPIFEAALSTALCVSSLFLVDLHMAQVFAKTMLLVTVLSVLHGLVVDRKSVV